MTTAYIYHYDQSKEQYVLHNLNILNGDCFTKVTTWYAHTINTNPNPKICVSINLLKSVIISLNYHKVFNPLESDQIKNRTYRTLVSHHPCSCCTQLKVLQTFVFWFDASVISTNIQVLFLLFLPSGVWRPASHLVSRHLKATVLILSLPNLACRFIGLIACMGLLLVMIAL